MKLFPTQRAVRVNSEDSLGQGMDAAIMLTLFLGAGYGLDRLFGTMPIFMIAMTVLGSVGLFAKFKYRYEQRMNELDAERIAQLAGPALSAPTMQATDLPAGGVTNGEAA